ncbi:MAG: hypothetical protein ACLU8D_08710 [Enterocloster sp.]
MNLKELNYIVTIADEAAFPRRRKSSIWLVQHEPVPPALRGRAGSAFIYADLPGRPSYGLRLVFLNHAARSSSSTTESELWDIEELSGGRISWDQHLPGHLSAAACTQAVP